MKQTELKGNELVKFAESIGFKPYEENRNFRRHFYWHMRDDVSLRDHEFSVHEHRDGGTSYRVREVGECGFTTAYRPDVLKRLEKIRDRGGH